MEFITTLIKTITSFVESYIVPPQLLIYALLGTGLFLTLRLGFIQLIRLKHGIDVTSGKYDDPDETGDVSHFQALTTALSATVGVGNIAGVAVAIHWGGPGALFWMWMTAFFGMAVKYSEVTLSLKYRQIDENAAAHQGVVAGGPMYYIEHGLSEVYPAAKALWKPLAIFFALGLMLTSFLTGNAIQANTLADQVESNFGISPMISGGLSAVFVAIIIFGGIRRIGKVTSVLAPLMAILYVASALIILAMNFGEIPAAFATIVTEAFNPTAGVAGTGAGVFMSTLMWGVKRGLFSNEAGQGSAPIAHAAAKTEEPVSEGVVALLEPFIDTLIICTITGLVLITTGVWNDKHPTELLLSSGDVTYLPLDSEGRARPSASYNLITGDAPATITVVDGEPQYATEDTVLAWHDVRVDRFFVDEAQTIPFVGEILPSQKKAVATDGTSYTALYGNAVENSAPLTAKAFGKGLGRFGEWVVLLCVVLFALSTAISWSYYGDRCANYVFGASAIIPFKVIYILFHFIGAVSSLNVIWNFGDVALSLVTMPNLLALLLLSGVVWKSTKTYFEKEPWRNDD
ncbi:alanine/glycine:cation symporter family protein [Acanthopleuribacter pedis]|uniref:Sodium:alanine symporter family protein n=1 Tax=Acanthopleuribacter pedis TaxID=442870 RepID=A0A8J7QS05_9BACT|nr:sodium:alanine symporter family protein [Acanthopleuribacter pedis]MBO1323185.1 sodium:alanine symporter family protein [Acanthopleuribacter pedis]